MAGTEDPPNPYPVDGVLRLGEGPEPGRTGLSTPQSELSHARTLIPHDRPDRDEDQAADPS